MPQETAAVARSVEALVRDHEVAGRGQADVVVGLIGRAIQLSRTPAMHEREAVRQGIRCAYVLIDFDALEFGDAALAAVLNQVEGLGFAGVNVTHPFKQSVLPLLDAVTKDASAIGAVNTIVLGGRRVGHNTDCWGFAESFRRGMKGGSLDHIALFGAGGAGSAVGYCLIGLGARRLSIIDPDQERSRQLAARLRNAGETDVRASTDVGAVVETADGIVNTTPVGMAKYPGTPFPTELLKPTHWVADVIYFPEETELLRRARTTGCRALPGIGMAIGQAVRAFELFTGRHADMDAMAEHYKAAS